MALKNIIIGIAILILTIFVTVYGINTFYPQPQYEDFCEMNYGKLIETPETCVAEGGKWTAYEGEMRPSPGYCDLEFECRKTFEDARERHARNVFFIALPLGILIIALGAFFFKLEAVGSGLMGGGVGTLIYGTWGFFWQTSDKIRFVISLAGLIILIWLAYYFNEKFEKKAKKKRR